MLIGGLPFHPVALLLAFGLGRVVTLAGALAFPAPQPRARPPIDALRPQQPGRRSGVACRG